jgi:uncharacterized protein YkwD
MPDDVGTSVVHRISRFCTQSRLAVAVCCTSLMTLGFVTLMPPQEPGAAEAGPAVTNAATTPAEVPSLTAQERDALKAIERYMQVAAQPTWTPVPPSATPVSATATSAPPTATPRPRATATRPAAAAPPPTVAAPTVVAEPTLPPPPPAPAAPTGLDTSPMDPYSQALFDATNKRRIDSGLPPLRANGHLVGIARIRSQDMADHNYFAHVSPITGDNAFTLMDKHGVPYGWAGENLAKNNYTVSECVHVADEALWNSPPHKENILSPNYTDMGIALVIDASGMKYFTIIFTGPE